ncbi:MAG: acetyl-CoA carboxylase carboxyltransferase subunit beta, partial [Acidimicrobiales bacterium]
MRLEIPADAWEKCDECGHIDIKERFARALNVCPSCGHHRRIGAQDYIDLLVDEGSWHEMDPRLRSSDPLRFEDYGDRLQNAVKKAGPLDAIRTGYARLDAMPVSLGVMDFAFMGGSMGSVVGEKIARLARRSIDKGVPLILVSASGGARMQEGVLSLMQMAKTSVVLAELGARRLPYISIVTNPTTGGVSASYAMQGDVVLAEPGAVVGFAGPRVIKQTIGQDL